jgi:hypothetical protein
MCVMVLQQQRAGRGQEHNQAHSMLMTSSCIHNTLAQTVSNTARTSLHVFWAHVRDDPAAAAGSREQQQQSQQRAFQKQHPAYTVHLHKLSSPSLDIAGAP